jgi:hypothetical protein
VCRNSKVGAIMAKLKLSPEFLREVRELAARWGKTAAERVTAEVGPTTTMGFRDIEQVAAVVAASLTESTVTTLLAAQAQQLAAEQPCPDCQRACTVEYRDRSLTLDTGELMTLHEPVCHCLTCRRDFFPPPEVAATGRTPVQSGGPPESG